MSEFELLTETEQLLLMAACVQGLGPGSSLVNANTSRVVNQVLRWRGFSDDEIRNGWRANECGWIVECGPVHDEAYRALIRMTAHLHSGRQPEKPGMPLFEGKGNWGVPGDPSHPASWPQYNSCRLTLEGERIAREFLERHPDYRNNGFS